MLTVLMATRNRAALLKDVLEAYCGLQTPSGGWKLVIVDNGSTDNTGDVVSDFRGRLPIQRLVEPKLGKNAALNTGLSSCEGDLVVFTDDDTFPHADWLARLRDAAETHPEHSMFGGAIAPRWALPPPDWIDWVDWGPTFTITPEWLSESELSSSSITWISGPNMAIRKAIFDSGIRFDESIGPRGLDYPMGSETELILRLSRNGHKGWFVPKAVVEHFIREEQLSKQWVLRRAVRWGRGSYRLAPNLKLWGSVPRHLYRDLPKFALKIAIAGAVLNPEARFRAQWAFNLLRGEAIEARALYRENHIQQVQAATGNGR